MKTRLIAAAMTGGILTGGATAPPPPVVRYQVHAAIETMNGQVANQLISRPVWIEQPDLTRPVELAPGSGEFELPSKRAEDLRDGKAFLVAKFSDGDTVSVPITLSTVYPSTRIVFTYGPALPCNTQNLNRLRNPGEHPSAHLRAYFLARRMALRGQCTNSARVEATRIWFQRSCDTARLYRNIRLDAHAERQLLDIDRREATQRQSRFISQRKPYCWYGSEPPFV